MCKKPSLAASVSLTWALSWWAIVINIPIYMPFSVLHKLGYVFPNWFWYLSGFSTFFVSWVGFSLMFLQFGGSFREITAAKSFEY